MDFSLAAKITGSRFVVMKGQLAKLHRALIQFMLDIHTLEHGYQEIYVPYIVNQDSLLGTGQLPKFEGDLFKIFGEHNYYLTSTAEIPVTIRFGIWYLMFMIYLFLMSVIHLVFEVKQDLMAKILKV